MKKLLRFSLIIGMAVCALAAVGIFAGCSGSDSLTAPRGLRINSDTLILSWSGIKNSVGYTVDWGDGEATARNNSYNLTALEAGNYRIRVKAKANKRSGKDSDWSDYIKFTREEESGLSYTLWNGNTEYEVSGMGSASEDVVVDEFFRGKPVTRIADGAFDTSRRLKSITLTDRITQIGKNAFSNVEKLESIVIPDSVTSIGAQAFLNCGSLKSITLPANLQVIDNLTFGYCASLEEIEIPETVTQIGTSAFVNCTSLTAVEIPDGVRTVGSKAFNRCSRLEAVYFGENVRQIGSEAFRECASLTETVFGPNLYEIGEYAFRDCDFTSIVIPNSVRIVGREAFAYCKNLDKIDVSDNLIQMGIRAFNGTKYWEDSDTLVYLNKWLLSCKDEELAEIQIRQDTVGIADNALRALNNLTAVRIPDQVKYIGRYAFAEDNNLRVVVFGENVETIAYAAFADCKNLNECHFEANKSLRFVGQQAFYRCEGLPSCNLPDTVEEIEVHAFQETGLTAENGVVYAGHWVVGADGVGSIRIADGTIGIAQYAFYLSSCSEVILPSSLKYINRAAFLGCQRLTNASLEGTAVEVVSNYAFRDCEALGQGYEYVIPEGVTSIGNGAFYNCNTMGDIILPNTLTEIGEYAFFNTRIGSLEIPDSVTTVGRSAFSHAFALRSITIGDGVTSLGNRAFHSCNVLQSVTIGSGLTAIDDYTFYNCPQLSAIVIPENVKSVGSFAFYGCRGLETVSLGSVESIGSYAFAGCTKLAQIAIGDSVTGIGNYAFRGCTSLAQAVIGKNVASMGNHVFYACPALTVYGVSSVGEDWSARWNSSRRPAIFGVTLENDGGADYILSFVKTAEGTLYLDASGEISTPVREGYLFDGWTTVPDGDAEYATSELADVKDGTTVYAVWISDMS